nr:MAG TPA_asm: hypothetical protein [Caudoviricetes sp.]
MKKVSTYSDVVNSFHSTFQDKVEIPDALERVWFFKAVGKFSHEIDRLNFDEELYEFDTLLDRYVIDTLGVMMHEFYQQRELSKVNKRVSIVTKDISVDGSGNAKTASKAELETIHEEVQSMLYKQTPTAYN